MEIPLKILNDYLLNNRFDGGIAIRVIKIDNKLYNIKSSFRFINNDISIIVNTWIRRDSRIDIVGIVIASRYGSVLHDKVYNLNIETLYEIEGVIKKYIYLNGKSVRSIGREFNLSRILETSA